MISFWKLIRNSITFYWRGSCATLAAVIVSTAVLSGALFVGDSVRYSLAMILEERLRGVQSALAAQEIFFTDGLADKLDGTAAPVLQLQGLVTNSDDTKRANNVQVLGVDERFYTLGGAVSPFADGQKDEIVLVYALYQGSGDRLYHQGREPKYNSTR